MWRLTSQLVENDLAEAAEINALSRATLERLLAITSIGLLAGALFISIDWNGLQISILMAGLVGIGLIFTLAYYFLDRNRLYAHVLWLAGMALAIVLATWLLQKPHMLLLSTILPLIAVLTLNNWAGALVLLGVGGLVWTAVMGLGIAPLPVSDAWLIIATGFCNCVLASAAHRELLAAARWAIAGFETARSDLRKAREWQLELAQSRADLIHANQELTRLSNRLKKLEQIAEEARQAKTEFVANVSHELRTPLNMIIGFAEVIASSPQVYGTRLNGPLLTDIAAIRRNAEHLSTLVNDVLDLSQVEAGRMALSRSYVDIQSLIEDAVTVVSGFFEARDLYLNCEFILESPDTPCPLVYCDATRIRQVIINLLGNAGRFTESGGVCLTCQVLKTEILISVADTGPGIPLHEQQLIFEPFQQASVSTRRQHGGSGLGLTISKQFVEMHAGRMWLESTPGAGTTVYFSLPIEQSYTPLLATAGEATNQNLRRSINPDDPIGYHLGTARAAAPVPPLAERFVVVDAEGDLKRLFGRFLPDAEVEITTDVNSAIATVQRSPAQALVLNIPPDEPLPAHLVQRLPYVTPIVTCWLPGRQEAARRLGVVEYLIKPITREPLLLALKRLGPGMKTVLIADDDEDELHLFARMIASDEQRFSILQVTNGQRALSMLRHRRPDVLLLDLIMPGMSGHEVLVEKAKDPAIAGIPVIIISSRDPSGDPIVGPTLTVTQNAGLSQRNIIACVQAIGHILAPVGASDTEK